MEPRLSGVDKKQGKHSKVETIRKVRNIQELLI